MKIADFYQNGIVATLHNFSNRNYDELEKELIEFSEFRPITLILPSLFSNSKVKLCQKLLKKFQKLNF